MGNSFDQDESTVVIPTAAETQAKARQVQLIQQKRAQQVHEQNIQKINGLFCNAINKFSSDGRRSGRVILEGHFLVTGPYLSSPDLNKTPTVAWLRQHIFPTFEALGYLLQVDVYLTGKMGSGAIVRTMNYYNQYPLAETDTRASSVSIFAEEKDMEGKDNVQ
jgi:hypothetical protein